jgi:hypothetical protein
MYINDSSNKYNSIYHNALKNVRLNETDTTSYPFSDFIRDYNHAHNRLATVIMESDASFEFHDFNYTDLPVETANLIANQKTYQFTKYHAQIVGIAVKDGNDVTVPQIVDERDPYWLARFESGDTGETPTHVMFYGNGYHFYPTPSVNVTDGIYLYFQQTPQMEDDTVTTTEPGVSQLFQEYYPVATARRYSGRFGPKDAFDYLYNEERLIEDSVRSYFEKRLANKPKKIAAKVHYHE